MNEIERKDTDIAHGHSTAVCCECLAFELHNDFMGKCILFSDYKKEAANGSIKKIGETLLKFSHKEWLTYLDVY